MKRLSKSMTASEARRFMDLLKRGETIDVDGVEYRVESVFGGDSGYTVKLLEVRRLGVIPVSFCVG
jgi:hypothetical protein